jgi:predicted nuclease with TOPRIM domain
MIYLVAFLAGVLLTGIGAFMLYLNRPDNTKIKELQTENETLIKQNVELDNDIKKLETKAKEVQNEKSPTNIDDLLVAFRRTPIRN